MPWLWSSIPPIFGREDNVLCHPESWRKSRYPSLWLLMPFLRVPFLRVPFKKPRCHLYPLCSSPAAIYLSRQCFPDHQRRDREETVPYTGTTELMFFSLEVEVKDERICRYGGETRDQVIWFTAILMPFSSQSEHGNKSMKSAWLFNFIFPGSCFEAMFPCSMEVKQCSGHSHSTLGLTWSPRIYPNSKTLILRRSQSQRDRPTVRWKSNPVFNKVEWPFKCSSQETP